MEDNEIKEKVLNLYEVLKDKLIENEKISNVQYYNDLELIPQTENSMGLLENVYLVEKEIVNDSNKVQKVYELYLEEGQKVAKVLEDGEVKFDENYINLLKERFNALYNKIGIEKTKINIEEILKQEKTEVTLEEIESYKKEKREKEIEGTEKAEQNKDEIEQEETYEKDEQEKEENKNQENDEKELENITRATGMGREDVKACTKINPEDKITDSENFYDILPASKQYKKIFIVASNSNTKGNTKFHFVGITPDGMAQEIEELEPREGVSTSNEIISINKDGSEVKEQQVSALFTIGSYNKGFSVSIGNYGVIEAQYIRRTPENEYIGININSTTQKPSTKEVKEFMSHTRNPYIQNNVDKAQKQIQETESKKTNIKNIDDNPNNDKTVDIDEEIRLLNGNITTIREEAESRQVPIQDYLEKFEKMQGNSTEEKIYKTNAQIEKEKSEDAKDEVEDEIEDEEVSRTPWGDAYARMNRNTGK